MDREKSKKETPQEKYKRHYDSYTGCTCYMCWYEYKVKHGLTEGSK